jgi:hypothetical protein
MEEEVVVSIGLAGAGTTGPCTTCDVVATGTTTGAVVVSWAGGACNVVVTCDVVTCCVVEKEIDEKVEVELELELKLELELVLIDVDDVVVTAVVRAWVAVWARGTAVHFLPLMVVVENTPEALFGLVADMAGSKTKT